MVASLLLALFGLVASRELPLEDNEIDLRQQAMENSDLFGGDMLTHLHENDLLGNAIANEDYRWPGYPGGATIPYVINKYLTSEKALIESGMKQYHNSTCVRFVPRTNEDVYVNIYYGRGCYAVLGRNRTFPQPQPLSLGRGCDKIGTIMHELGHVLGIYHEQNRSDRDDYLNIYLENVKEGKEHNFIKLTSDEDILFTGFDYDSIMLYSNYAFSKQPGVLKTMEAKNGQELKSLDEKTKLSNSDIERVNKMYKCSGY